jgi:peptide/nickel transport system permease protein
MLHDVLHRLTRNRLVVLGTLLAGSVVLFAVLGPILGRYAPDEMHMTARFSPPSRRFLLGTDNFGRDLLSRVAVGARISLRVSLISVLTAALAGATLGVFSGYFGGAVDAAVMYVIEVLLAFPSLLLALAIMGVLGSNLTNLVLAISVVYVPVFARLVRGEVLSVRERLFVEAARAIGASPLRVIGRHILPNILSLIIVQMTIQLSYAILAESSLSYLGFGTQPPTPSWGRMLNEGRSFLGMDPWMSVWPGLFVMTSLIGFNLLGDGLRDALDPWQRGR